MKRIIINYKDTTEKDAIEYVEKVIEQGRVSGESYCKTSIFKDGALVLAEVSRRNSDVFRVYGKVKNKPYDGSCGCTSLENTGRCCKADCEGK